MPQAKVASSRHADASLTFNAFSYLVFTASIHIRVTTVD
jgi:hypothetical protein